MLCFCSFPDWCLECSVDSLVSGLDIRLITVQYMALDKSIGRSYAELSGKNGPKTHLNLRRSYFVFRFEAVEANRFGTKLLIGLHNLDKSRPQIPRMIQSAMRRAFVLLLTCSLK